VLVWGEEKDAIDSVVKAPCRSCPKGDRRGRRGKAAKDRRLIGPGAKGKTARGFAFQVGREMQSR